MSARAIAVLLAAVLLPVAGHAQVPLTNACQTQFGVCLAPVAPVGTPCSCIPAYGPPHPGRMIFTSPPGGPAQAPMNPAGPPISNACGTQFGVCPVMPAPVGSPCGCGPHPGQVIIFR
jgi:hypothetical protein